MEGKGPGSGKNVYTDTQCSPLHLPFLLTWRDICPSFSLWQIFCTIPHHVCFMFFSTTLLFINNLIFIYLKTTMKKVSDGLKRSFYLATFTFTLLHAKKRRKELEQKKKMKGHENCSSELLPWSWPTFQQLQITLTEELVDKTHTHTHTQTKTCTLGF